MTQQPYSPWPVAEKPVSQDRMREILAARTNNVAGPSPKPAEECPSGPPSSAAPGIPSGNAALEWGKTIWYEPGVVGCQISTCGRYRIDKCGSSYTAWRKAQRRDHLNLRLGEVDKLEAAQALCGTDAQSV